MRRDADAADSDHPKAQSPRPPQGRILIPKCTAARSVPGGSTLIGSESHYPLKEIRKKGSEAATMSAGDEMNRFSGFSGFSGFSRYSQRRDSTAVVPNLV